MHVRLCMRIYRKFGHRYITLAIVSVVAVEICEDILPIVVRVYGIQMWIWKEKVNADSQQRQEYFQNINKKKGSSVFGELNAAVAISKHRRVWWTLL